MRLIDYDDYPDDISDYESDEMEQCKRIFEEYQAPAEIPQPEIKVLLELSKLKVKQMVYV